MKNINKLLEKWFSKNLGIELEFKEDSTFGYDDIYETIYYSFTEKTEGDKYFRELCEQIYPGASQFSDFILSLFHEVGHSITDDDFDDETLDEYDDFVNNIKELDKETFLKYYNHPVEKEATAEGMYLIQNNEDKVKELEKAIFKNK